tara:strand:+ start:573 stop:746 length:174 start_codon:yes stop_codon:yes gene_type:complete
MKYLALSADGNIYSLGDCGDWLAANEIAEEYMDVEPVWITTIDEWVKLADVINNEKE